MSATKRSRIVEQDKYFISYGWDNPMGMYVFTRHYSTNSLILFLAKFVVLSFRYGVIDIQYRNNKE